MLGWSLAAAELAAALAVQLVAELLALLEAAAELVVELVAELVVELVAMAMKTVDLSGQFQSRHRSVCGADHEGSLAFGLALDSSARKASTSA